MNRLGWIACVVCACNGSDSDGASPAFFPTDLQGSGYVQVRGCRAPGEHSALGGFTVWVDAQSESAFAALWSGARSEMPAGSIIVKETYAGPDCLADDVVGWLAMKKEPGFAPDDGDWHWQELDRARELRVDGADLGCIGCHRGTADTTCVGYGAENGFDFVCTEP